MYVCMYEKLYRDVYTGTAVLGAQQQTSLQQTTEPQIAKPPADPDVIIIPPYIHISHNVETSKEVARIVSGGN